MSALVSVLLIGVGLPAVAAAQPKAPAALRQSAPDGITAARLARAQGSRVKVSRATTPTSETFANPDGTFTDELSVVPTRAKSATGDWAPVDTALAIADGRVRPKNHPAELSMSAGGDETLATLGDATGSLSVKWAKPLPAPTVSGDIATYTNVADDTALTVRATRSGYEDSVVVDRADSVSDVYRFSLTLRKWSASIDKSGAITLFDSSGHRVGSIAPARMYDSQLDALSGEPTHFGAVSTALVREPDGGQTLELRPDPDFVTAASTVYPVTIDPAVHLGEATDMWAASNGTSGTTGELRVGYYNGNAATHRTWMKFDPSAVKGKHIIDADLALWQWYTPSACAAKEARIYALSSGFSDSTTWATQPSAGPTIWATSSAAYGSSACPANWNRFDVTSLVNGWANGTVANYGLLVRSAVESDTQAWWRFDGMDTATTSHVPSLSVVYNSYPSTITTGVTSPGSLDTAASPQTLVAPTTTPRLTATSCDADGGTVRLDFEIWNTAHTALIASGNTGFVDQCTQAGVTVPANKLVNGSSYDWRVRGFDGTDYARAWSPYNRIKADTSAPAAPSSLASTAYPSSTWTQTGAAGTFTWSENSSDVSHFLYGFDTASPAIATTALSATFNPVPDGWHTLTVIAVDKAGNRSAPTSYTFGAMPKVLSPGDGGRTQGFVTLRATTKPVASPYAGSVTFRYRTSAEDVYTDIPAADVSQSGMPITAWPLNFSGSASDLTSPDLVWDLAHTLSDATMTVQVQACFGAGAPVCSAVPVSLTLDEGAYGDSYATADVGVGTVSLQTGNLQVEEIDASVPAYGTTLSVGRSFDSRTPSAPADGPFGPGWQPSFSVDSASSDFSALRDFGLTVNAELPDGAVVAFSRSASGTLLATGDGSLDGWTLTATGGAGPPNYGPTSFVLTDGEGNTTTFEPVGTFAGDAALAVPHAYRVASVSQPGSGNTTTFTYLSGRLTQIKAPVPSGSTCTDSSSDSTWYGACRALQFSYDTSGHISAVTLATTDATNARLFVDVSCFAYTGGRLTQSWDPRTAAAGSGNHPITCGNATLPTAYTYSSDGRLASVADPGLQPTTISYDLVGRVTDLSRQHANGGITETRSLAYLGSGALTPDPTHTEYRPDMRASATSTWAQADQPVTATAVFAPGHSVSSDDLREATVHYLDVNGREVNSAEYAGVGPQGWHVDTTEFDMNGLQIRHLDPANREEALDPTGTRGAALGLPTSSAAAARMLDEQTFYNTSGDVTDTFGPYRPIVLPSWNTATGRSRVRYEYDTGNETGHPAGGSLRLVTRTVAGASLGAAADPTAPVTTLQDIRVVATEYALDATNNEGWALRQPLRSVEDPGTGSLNVTRASRFDPATGLLTRSSGANDTGGTGPGSTRLIYWTAGSNSVDSACGSKPQWTHLVCKSTPVAQPVSSGLPGLPVQTVNYDYLFRAVTSTQTVTGADSATRTRTMTFNFEANGYGPRLTSVSVAATGAGSGKAIPTVSTTYDAATGLPTQLAAAATAELPAGTVATAYDDFGRVTSYTDADGNQSTTNYDSAGRISSMSNARGTQTLTYNGGGERRDLATSSTVSGLTGSFQVTYDSAGRVISETAPNGITTATAWGENGDAVQATTTFNGQQLYKETTSTNAFGQTRISEASTAVETQEYDNAGRLRFIQDLYGDLCETRSYALDSTSNRTGMTRYAQDVNGLCQRASGGVSVSHSYDNADRLLASGVDSGLAYDAFGRVTVVPGADVLAAAGGNTTISYYTNDFARSQTANGRTLTSELDPTLRIRRTVDSLSGTKTFHYDGTTDSPSWIAENASGTSWTRYIRGLGGRLSLSMDDAGGKNWAVSNLHGDVIATVDDIGTPTYQSADEFGVPRDGLPRRYGWLGTFQRSGEAFTGLMDMGVRLYSPILGRFLQTDPVPGGNDNAYEYCGADPVNCYDLDGQFGIKWPKWVNTAVTWADNINTGIALVGMLPGCEPLLGLSAAIGVATGTVKLLSGDSSGIWDLAGSAIYKAGKSLEAFNEARAVGKLKSAPKGVKGRGPAHRRVRQKAVREHRNFDRKVVRKVETVDKVYTSFMVVKQWGPSVLRFGKMAF